MILTRTRALPSDPRALFPVVPGARRLVSRVIGGLATRLSLPFRSAPGDPPGGPPPFSTLELSSLRPRRQAPPRTAGQTQPIRGHAKATIGWFLKSARNHLTGVQRANANSTD